LTKAGELLAGVEENAALALLQDIRIYALDLSQLREIRKRLMRAAGDNRFGYIGTNSEHAPQLLGRRMIHIHQRHVLQKISRYSIQLIVCAICSTLHHICEDFVPTSPTPPLFQK